MLQHAREIAPSVSWDILVQVKRTGGISVNELAALLKMSYMGVKQHCDDLKKRGYVDTWRRPKTTGRPEKIFRPTPKLDTILPSWGNELCMGILALVAQVDGEAGPERLIFRFLQQKGEKWAAKLKGKTIRDRAKEFAKARIADGWMCEVFSDERGTCIVEHHSPLAEISRLYPNVAAVELRVLESCFGGPVRREEQGHANELWLPPDPAPAPQIAPVALESNQPAFRETLFD